MSPGVLSTCWGVGKQSTPCPPRNCLGSVRRACGEQCMTVEGGGSAAPETAALLSQLPPRNLQRGGMGKL